MARHGSRVREVPTSLSAPVVATATLPVVFGTAPINLAETLENVNKPVLAYSFPEFVKALGYSEDWKSYTLCEMADLAFRQFSVGPVVFVNVLDPTKHKTSKEETIDVISKKSVIETEGILFSSLVVSQNETPLSSDQDYIATFNDDGQIAIAVLKEDVTQLKVKYDYLTPEVISNNHIIGGYDISSGKSTGLELLNNVFPKFSMVPGLVLAPKFSKDPTVAAVMKAKASSINTYFCAQSLDDVNTLEANTYTKVNEWKNKNNYTGNNEVVCWPLTGIGDKVYHLSSQIACRIMKTAYDNGDFPHESPSNKPLTMTKLLVETADGYEEIELSPDQAELLNNQGITTAINFIGGWRAWGNYTAAYPASTDVKDTFIPVRVTHNWLANTIILTTWSKVDGPIGKRLIDNILDTMNMWLNGLQGAGVLIGARVEFRDEDNPLTDLISGKLRFRYLVAEPTPAQDIDNILEFDASYYKSLFVSE
ncbi:MULTISPECIES: phage tail sheath family protein [unclassified Lysinibacillus]|uniref:phage tail sheath family protein n=1 Tax=unclassified Lysinibacillus TaxID=2636778 RepID=UPI00380338E0